MKTEQNILHEVKNVDNEINKLLVPVLQDTIKDTNKHNKRMFILNVLLLAIVLIISLFSAFLIYKQNIKYQEFLSQFDFETEYIQDVSADNNSSSEISSGININR